MRKCQVTYEALELLLDDEPVTEEESEAIAEGLRDLDEGDVISDEEFRRRLIR